MTLENSDEKYWLVKLIILKIIICYDFLDEYSGGRVVKNKQYKHGRKNSKNQNLFQLHTCLTN